MAGRFNVGDHVDAIEVKNRWAAAVIVSVGRVAGYRVRFDGSGKEVPVGEKEVRGPFGRSAPPPAAEPEKSPRRMLSMYDARPLCPVVLERVASDAAGAEVLPHAAGAEVLQRSPRSELPPPMRSPRDTGGGQRSPRKGAGGTTTLLEEMQRRVAAAEAEAAAFDAELVRLQRAHDVDEAKLAALLAELAIPSKSESDELEARLRALQQELAYEEGRTQKYKELSRRHEVSGRAARGVEAEVEALERQTADEVARASRLENELSRNILAVAKAQQEVEEARAKAAQAPSPRARESDDVVHYRSELAAVRLALADETERVTRLKAALDHDIRTNRGELDATEGDYQRQLAKLRAQLAAMAEGK